MLKQLSIFAENTKGRMQEVTGILLREDINILGSVTNDSAEYGIVRMVVSKPELRHEEGDIGTPGKAHERRAGPDTVMVSRNDHDLHAGNGREQVVDLF